MTVGLLSFASVPIVSPFVLNLSFDASAQAAPQSFRDTCNAAAAALMAVITDPITMNIIVGYNETPDGLGGSVATNLGAGARSSDLGETTGGINQTSYTTIRAALSAKASRSANSTSLLNSLPNTSSLNGSSNFYLPRGLGKALGLIAANDPALDGSSGIGSSVPAANLLGVCIHEFTHAMGREHGSAPFDFCRFLSPPPGARNFGAGSTSPAQYFSVDGGATSLVSLATSSDPGDFAATNGDIFQALYAPGVTQNPLSAVDLKVLDAIGFTVLGVV